MTVEIVSRTNAEHYTWGRVCDGWHLLKTPGLSVIQERVPPGGSEIRHYHERAQQFFFVLMGEATMEVGGARVIVGAHEGVSVPPGSPHRLLNEAAGELTFILISAPASHGDRVNAD